MQIVPVFWGLMKLLQMHQLLHKLDFLDYITVLPVLQWRINENPPFFFLNGFVG